ncbi:MAG: hypothetical protein J7M05_11420, partial [Anaerolineae bacterium]|nr:hypothetical protein [Anaerolineae bacterium]
WVGPGNDACSPNGHPDASIDLWLTPGADASPIQITGITVQVAGMKESHRWDTDPNTEDWVVGVTEGSTLLNPEISFQRVISQPSHLVLYIDEPAEASLFTPGRAFTVTLTLSQGNWVAQGVIPSCPSEEENNLASKEGASVSGTVWCLGPQRGDRFREHKAATGVKLTLIDSLTGEVIAEQVTDASGRYRFEGLKWRHYYLIQAPIEGYEPVFSRFWGVAATEGSEIIINFENRPLVGQKPTLLYLPLVTR